MVNFKSYHNYRHDIDRLRDLVVYFVMIYHVPPNFLKCGFIEVDIIFVIFGYLMGGIILRGLSTDTFSLAYFYSRRILRIFPALIFVLFTGLLAGHFLLFHDGYQIFGKYIMGGSTFVANLVYWKEIGYGDVNVKLKSLSHFWCLGVEKQFYIVIPLLLICAWKTIPKKIFATSE